MGKLQAIKVPGCECWFHSRDHTPEHFHAASPGEWEVKVLFMRNPVEIEIVFEDRKIPRRVLSSLRSLAASNRTAIFLEWSQKVGQ